MLNLIGPTLARPTCQNLSLTPGSAAFFRSREHDIRYGLGLSKASVWRCVHVVTNALFRHTRDFRWWSTTEGSSSTWWRGGLAAPVIGLGLALSGPVPWGARRWTGGFGQSVILGDSGSPLRTYLMTPVTIPRNILMPRIYKPA